MTTQARTFYEFAGLPRIAPPTSLANTALLLIDIQNDYLPTGKVPLDNIEKAIEECAKILALARKNKLPVIHVVHHGPPGGGLFDPTGTGSEIVPSVAPIAGEDIVPKHYADSFVDTTLKSIITAKGIKHLIVIGFMTHNCVSSTVRAAKEHHGLAVTVIGNATGTRALRYCVNLRDYRRVTMSDEATSAQDVHRAHLSGLADFFAHVADSIEDLNLLQ